MGVARISGKEVLIEKKAREARAKFLHRKLRLLINFRYAPK